MATSNFPELPVLYPFSVADTIPTFLEKTRFNFGQLLVYTSKLSSALDLLPDGQSIGLQGLPGYTQPLQPGPIGPRGASFFFLAAPVVDGDPVPAIQKATVGDVAIDPSGAFFDVVSDALGNLTYRFQANYSLTLPSSFRTQYQFSQLSPLQVSHWVPKPTGVGAGGHGSFVLADQNPINNNLEQQAQFYDLLLGMDALPQGSARSSLTVTNLVDPANPQQFRGQVQFRYRPTQDTLPTAATGWLAFTDSITETRFTMDLGEAAVTLRQFPNLPAQNGVTLRGGTVLLSGTTADLNDLDPSGPGSGQYVKYEFKGGGFKPLVLQTVPHSLTMISGTTDGKLSLAFRIMEVGLNGIGQILGSQQLIFSGELLTMRGDTVDIESNVVNFTANSLNRPTWLQTTNAVDVRGLGGIRFDTSVSTGDQIIPVVNYVVDLANCVSPLIRVTVDGSSTVLDETVIKHFINGRPGQVITITCDAAGGNSGLVKLSKSGDFSYAYPYDVIVTDLDFVTLRLRYDDTWEIINSTDKNYFYVDTFQPPQINYNFDNLRIPGIWTQDAAAFINNAAPFGFSVAAQDSTHYITTQVIVDIFGTGSLTQKQWSSKLPISAGNLWNAPKEFVRQLAYDPIDSLRKWTPWVEVELNNGNLRSFAGARLLSTAPNVVTFTNQTWVPDGTANFYKMGYGQVLSGIASIGLGALLYCKADSGGVVINLGGTTRDGLPILCPALQQRGVSQVILSDDSFFFMRLPGAWQLMGIENYLLKPGSGLPTLPVGGLVNWDASLTDAARWDNGKGRGDMTGWAACNGQNNMPNYPAPFPNGTVIKWVGVKADPQTSGQVVTNTP